MKLTIVILIIVACIFVIYILSPRNESIGLGIAYTKAELSILASDVQISIALKDTNNISEPNNFAPQNIDDLIKWLYGPFLKDASRYFDANTSILIDAWHTPIELSVKTRKEYVLISAGPNRKFEDGKGDDIKYTFNPYELAEEGNKK